MKENIPTNVIVVIGAGSIGQAIARRVSAGKHVLLADLRLENAEVAAKGKLVFPIYNPGSSVASPHRRFGSLCFFLER